MSGPIRTALAFLIPAGLILLFLFRPLRLRIEAVFRWEGDCFRLFITVRFGFFIFRLRYKPVFIRGLGLTLAAEKHGELRPPKQKSAIRKQKRRRVIHALLPAVSVEDAALSGKVGVADDAAVCCFLAGALGAFLSGLIRAAAIAFLGGRASFSPKGRVEPVFFENRFELAFSGIVAAIPAKLIKSLPAAAAGKRKMHKKEKKYAPDRKHHANLHGADQAYGGC